MIQVISGTILRKSVNNVSHRAFHVRILSILVHHVNRISTCIEELVDSPALRITLLITLSLGIVTDASMSVKLAKEL